MIKVLNEALEEQGTLEGVLSSYDTEKLNSDMVAGCQVILTKDNTSLIIGTNVIELNDDYYDIAYYQKGQNSDGQLVSDVEAEHVSYRLNKSEYDKEYFTELGEPDYILGKILEGTGFTVGTVEFSGQIAYSLQEKMSRRLTLMDFVNYLGGEVKFEKFQVSIVQRRGSAVAKDLMEGGNVQVLNKIFDRRDTDSSGDPLISYTCDLIDHVDIELGDSVTMLYSTLDIDVELRVVSITRDPYNKYNIEFEIGNFVPGLEDEARMIEVSSLRKGSKYYGARISPEIGFESVRNDGLARAFFNGDTTAMQKWVEDAWKNILWFDSNEQEFYFDGKLTAQVIEATAAVITYYIAAEKGSIAELTVDQVDTNDMVRNFLASITADVNYIKAYDQYLKWITASTDGQSTEQETDRKGNLLYWTSAERTAASTDVTEWPVWKYAYDESTKLEISFEFDAQIGAYTPKMVWGAGIGNTEYPDRGKGFIYKDDQSLVFEYIKANGEVVQFKVGENGIEGIGTVMALEQLDIYDNGFIAKYQDTDAITYSITKDVNGYINQITNKSTSGVIPVNVHTGSNLP